MACSQQIFVIIRSDTTANESSVFNKQKYSGVSFEIMQEKHLNSTFCWYWYLDSH